jgi:hypothetical protein
VDKRLSMKGSGVDWGIRRGWSEVGIRGGLGLAGGVWRRVRRMIPLRKGGVRGQNRGLR